MNGMSNKEKTNGYDETSDQDPAINTPKNSDSKIASIFDEYTHHTDGSLISGKKEIILIIHDAKTNTISSKHYNTNGSCKVLELRKPIMPIERNWSAMRLTEWSHEDKEIIQSIFVSDSEANDKAIVYKKNKYIINPHKIDKQQADYIVTANIQKEFHANSKISCLQEKEFHANGKISRLQEKKFDNKENLLIHTVSNYNIIGNIITKRKYDLNNTCISSRKFKYVDFNNKEVAPSEEWHEQIESRYNNKDELIAKIKVSSNGEISDSSTFKYDYEKDQDGNLLRCIQSEFNPNGELMGRTQSYYNTDGQVIKIVVTEGKDDNPYRKIISEYHDVFIEQSVFDSNKRLVSFIVFDRNKEIFSKKKNFYSEINGKVFLTIITGKDNEPISKAYFEYHPDGVLKMKNKESYEYNDNNFLYENNFTNSSGKLIKKYKVTSYSKITDKFIPKDIELKPGTMTEVLYKHEDNHYLYQRKVTDLSGELIAKYKINSNREIINNIELKNTELTSGTMTEELYKYEDNCHLYQKKITDLSGKLIGREESVIKYNVDDGYLGEREAKYNSKNDIISVEITNGNIEFLSKSTYTYNYDINGKWSTCTESVFNSDDDIVEKKMTNNKGENITVLTTAANEKSDYSAMQGLMDAVSSFSSDTKETPQKNISSRDVHISHNIINSYQRAA